MGGYVRGHSKLNAMQTYAREDTQKGAFKALCEEWVRGRVRKGAFKAQCNV